MSTPPNDPWPHWRGGRHRGLWWGGLLVVLGVYFLLQNLGLLNSLRWDLVWPVILIALGVWILIPRPR